MRYRTPHRRSVRYRSTPASRTATAGPSAQPAAGQVRVGGGGTPAGTSPRPGRAAGPRRPAPGAAGRTADVEQVVVGEVAGRADTVGAGADEQELAMRLLLRRGRGRQHLGREPPLGQQVGAGEGAAADGGHRPGPEQVLDDPLALTPPPPALALPRCRPVDLEPAMPTGPLAEISSRAAAPSPGCRGRRSPRRPRRAPRSCASAATAGGRPGAGTPRGPSTRTPRGWPTASGSASRS